jgi:prepilin-type N-terminal cleavage/methylation domain-containing protein
LKKTAQTKGFTLVELLVVIAIIAILAAVVLLIINPLELTRRGRDAARLSDMANLQQAINVAVQEATGSGASSILCAGGLTGGVCLGKTSDSSSTVRASDGTGWVKVNLSTQQSVSVPTLPIDPVNNTAYHYVYCSDGNSWEINAVLESQQQSSKMDNDGGDETDKYEVGSALTLVNPSASCQY